MKAISRLSTSLLIALMLAPTTVARATTPSGAKPCPFADCPGNGNVGTTDTGFKYVYSNKAFYKVPTRGTGPGGSETNSDPGQQYEFFYQMDCPGAPGVTAGGDVGDLSCDQTGTPCADAGGVLLLVWYRPVGSTATPVESSQPLCSKGNTKITLPELLVIVDPLIDLYMQKHDLDTPQILSQPTERVLVNLPTIFSTVDQGIQEMPIADPMPGTVTLVPSYAWDFGDGSPSNANSAGVRYDGTDPQKDPGHYPVLHTFRKAQAYNVKITVTWTATTLHLNGLGDFPLTDKTKVFDNTLAVNAHEAHAVLVSGG